MVVQVDGGAGRQNAHLDTEDAGSVSVHVPLQPLHEGEVTCRARTRTSRTRTICTGVVKTDFLLKTPVWFFICFFFFFILCVAVN